MRQPWPSVPANHPVTQLHAAEAAATPCMQPTIQSPSLKPTLPPQAAEAAANVYPRLPQVLCDCQLHVLRSLMPGQIQLITVRSSATTSAEHTQTPGTARLSHFSSCHLLEKYCAKHCKIHRTTETSGHRICTTCQHWCTQPTNQPMPQHVPRDPP